MPIVTSHHVVPDPLQGGAGSIGVQSGGGSGSAIPAAESVSNATVTGGFHVGYAPLAVFLAVLLAIAVAAILLTTRHPPMSSQDWMAGEEPEALGDGYSYHGARARLRRVFLRVRGRFEPKLGSRVLAATARELARIDSSLEWFAAEYSRAMYSRLEPSEGDVERIARLAGEEP